MILLLINWVSVWLIDGLSEQFDWLNEWIINFIFRNAYLSLKCYYNYLRLLVFFIYCYLLIWKHPAQSCLLNATSCLNTGNGNYQYCGNCRYFATCSEKYFYVRACPVNLQYDMFRERCDYVSNTCQDDFTTRSTPRTTTVN